MQVADFLRPRPAFYFHFSLQCLGFGGEGFCIHDFYRFVRASVFAVLARFMVGEALVYIISNTRIKTIVRTEENIDVPHGRRIAELYGVFFDSLYPSMNFS